MEIKKEYLQKYIHSVAIDQLADEYRSKGYKVLKEELVGKYKADMIAVKGDETLVFEVKAGKLTPEKKAAIRGLADYIRDKGNYKFLVVLATPPREKKLEVANIEELLFQYVIDNMPYELDELSTHSRPEQIDDVEIDEINVNKDGSILVKGNAVISLELQFGSDSDQHSGMGHKMYDSFPLSFEISLEFDDNKGYIISSMLEPTIKVDTSSYYV
jgi:Holliday junction resolvase